MAPGQSSPVRWSLGSQARLVRHAACRGPRRAARPRAARQGDVRRGPNACRTRAHASSVTKARSSGTKRCAGCGRAASLTAPRRRPDSGSMRDPSGALRLRLIFGAATLLGFFSGFTAYYYVTTFTPTQAAGVVPVPAAAEPELLVQLGAAHAGHPVAGAPLPARARLVDAQRARARRRRLRCAR